MANGEMASLERIDVHLLGIAEVIATKRVIVPPYQRLYAWTEDQVGDLFRDLADAIRKGESEYFLGTVVLTRGGTGAQAIIDGQQRLTTTSILLAAIRDYLYEKDDFQRAETLRSEYLTKTDFATLESTPQVRLSPQDHEYFEARILAVPSMIRAAVKATTQSQVLLEKAALATRKFLNTLVSTTQSPRELLIQWVAYIRTNAKVIVVSVANEANAFTIFEVLNDRGLDLSIADLLKNFLFRLTNDRVSEAQTSWMRMTSYLDASGERDTLKTFIRHVWSSKHGLTREKDLYDAIRTRIASKQEAVTFVKELESSAFLYASFRNSGHENWKQYGSTVSQAIDALDTLRATQLRPLLISALTHFDVAEVRKLIPALVAWTVRFMIVGKSGSGPLETSYSDRAKDISEGKIKTANDVWRDMQRVIPSDDEFQDSFKIATVSTHYLARYYLGVIEAYKRSPTAEVIVNPNEEKVTLEHILPQSPSEEWPHITQAQRESYVRRIGNLTLLDKKLNEKAGNVSFEKKRELFQHSDIMLTRELADFSGWSTQSIEKRQSDFAEIAVKVWASKPKA